MLIRENRWRAQRYGFTRGLIDFGKAEIVDYHDLLEELIELTAEDQEILDCVAEVAQAREILHRGSSADNQVRVYDAALAANKSEQEALDEVVDWLIDETVHDIPV